MSTAALSQPTSGDPHAPCETASINGGIQHKYQFDNGYGASVVQHSFSYGGDAGKWELAVLGKDGRLTYATPITDDVIGWLDWTDVLELLDQIAALGD